MEVSVFVDESGGQGLETTFYLVTLLFHDQNVSLDRNINLYEHALADRRLPAIPFHSDPLMNGHGCFASMDLKMRKGYFSTFMTFLQHLPISYHTFSYKVSDYVDRSDLSDALRRDFVNFFFDHLAKFQQYDLVKVYYDNGQGTVTEALHDAIEYAIYKNSVVYRKATPHDYYLLQAADLICTVELYALKCETSGMTPTGSKFFGTQGYFKKNYLKRIRAKLA